MEPINTMDHASTALKIVLSAFPQHYALNARTVIRCREAAAPPAIRSARHVLPTLIAPPATKGIILYRGTYGAPYAHHPARPAPTARQTAAVAISGISCQSIAAYLAVAAAVIAQPLTAALIAVSGII
jgi:hypothetical protein